MVLISVRGLETALILGISWVLFTTAMVFILNVNFYASFCVGGFLVIVEHLLMEKIRWLRKALAFIAVVLTLVVMALLINIIAT